MIIYLALNKVNNKVYVGQTINPLNLRKKSHLNPSDKNTYHFANAVRKYGKDKFEWYIILECSDIDELNYWEIFFIKLFKATNRKYGYNMMAGGDNRIKPKEVCEKISIGRKGKPAWNKGKHYKLYNDEQKEVFRAMSTGRKHTQEAKDRISESKIGKKRDPETIKKIVKNRRSYKGTANPFYDKKHSDQAKNKIGEAKKSVPRKQKSIDKQRETMQKLFRENPEKFQQLYNQSIKPKSAETRKRMSESRKKYWKREKANAR